MLNATGFNPSTANTPAFGSQAGKQLMKATKNFVGAVTGETPKALSARSIDGFISKGGKVEATSVEAQALRKEVGKFEGTVKPDDVDKVAIKVVKNILGKLAKVSESMKPLFKEAECIQKGLSK